VDQFCSCGHPFNDNWFGIHIVEINGKDKKGDRYDPSTNTIYWNPSEGLLTTNGTKLSAATALDHEGDHADDNLTDPEGHLVRANTPDANYDNAEEARVIKGSEQTDALGMGEIKKGQVTRTDHNSLGTIKTKDPLSTNGEVTPASGTLLPTITITPKPKKKKDD
jgi:hypothetical protein